MIKLKEDSSFESLEENVFKRRSDIKEECEKNKEMDKIQELIFETRVKSGLSQEELAEKLGTSQAVISRLESGIDFNPKLKTIINIFQALGKDIVISLADKN